MSEEGRPIRAASSFRLSVVSSGGSVLEKLLKACPIDQPAAVALMLIYSGRGRFNQTLFDPIVDRASSDLIEFCDLSNLKPHRRVCMNRLCHTEILRNGLGSHQIGVSTKFESTTQSSHASVQLPKPVQVGCQCAIIMNFHSFECWNLLNSCLSSC